jgi:hypothetical protein
VIWNTYELNTFSGRKDNPDIKAYISPRLLSGLVRYIREKMNNAVAETGIVLEGY